MAFFVNVTSKMISEIVREYNSGMSINIIRKRNGINHRKVIKILVSAGVYSSERYDKIKDMRESGKSDSDIACSLGLSIKTINDYTPYKKGIYNQESPTENAIRIRRHRENKGN